MVPAAVPLTPLTLALALAHLVVVHPDRATHSQALVNQAHTQVQAQGLIPPVTLGVTQGATLVTQTPRTQALGIAVVR